MPTSPFAQRYATVRARTVALAAPLGEADCQVQSMPEASPTKWHLAHVTWFFETFVLERFEPRFKPHHPAYRVLFNSYYQGVGEQHPRPQRGLITRPTLAEVLDYRRAVDERMAGMLEGPASAAMAEIVGLGLQHEQQHQELLLTDVLHLLSCNPLGPAYQPPLPRAERPAPALEWVASEGGLVEIGHDGKGFAFDNEGPRHRLWLQPHALANRLTTQGEWAEFIADGGYTDPRWWLAAGWDWLRANRIAAPMYWRRSESGKGWQVFTLHGWVALSPGAPIAHVNLYEADAYARWSAARHRLPLRLPTEAEWESAAASRARAGIAEGNFAESAALVPLPLVPDQAASMQLFGDVWEWTASSYLPYPGFRPWAGAVGEYNGKFMVNQTVLRGGSCATPRTHIRASYRNFFPAETRWQFSGVRLARDAE